MKRKIKVDESNVRKESNRKDWEGGLRERNGLMGRACEIPSESSPCKSHVGQRDVAVKRTAR